MRLVKVSCFLAAMILAFSLVASAREKPARSNSQPVKVHNVNPDPTGEPWMVGGYPDVLTLEQMKKIENLPLLDLSKRSVALPAKVNNAANKYFRPIFNQQGGSCAQASGVGYHFTYAVNQVLGTSAKLLQNQYPSHYSYNFLNEGSGDVGSISPDGWDVINANGCPTLAVFGGMAGNDLTNTKWMNGYDQYVSGMQVRVKSQNRINLSTEAGLNTLRQWLFDYGEGKPVGGLANFSCVVCDSTGKILPFDVLPAGTEDSGKKVVTKWGVTGGHAMVFVGYNDSVRFDYNKDGKYTKNIDINGDGKVDVRDWEIGALIIANSWGVSWSDSGCIYMMYKVAADKSSDGGIRDNNNVIGIKATVDYATRLTYKVKLRHNIRNQIKIVAGIANDTSATTPEFEYNPPIFNFQGGEFPMEGKFMGEEIEVGLDANKLLTYLSAKQAKFFLTIRSLGGSGKVTSYSLVEYRNLNKITEVKCAKENVEIKPGTTTLTINYAPVIPDLIIETATLPDAPVNVAYSQNLTASGGKAPYTWSLNTKEYSSALSTGPFPGTTKTSLKPDDVDDGYVEQKLDFQFPFFGDKYTSVYVSTDGSILFEPGFQYIRSNGIIPAYKTITAFGADLTFETPGDSIYYEGSADSATFHWKTTKFWGKDDKVNVDFAARIYPSGVIKFFYNNDFTNGILGAGFGISSGNKDDYKLLPFDNTDQIVDQQVVTFTPFQMPLGLSFAPTGAFTGTPTEPDKSYRIVVSCKDADGNSKTRALSLKTVSAVTSIKNQIAAISAGMRYYRMGSKLVFSYTTQSETAVRLEILSLSGKTIATLVDGKQTAGSHSVAWNVGGKLSAGTYLYRLAIGKQCLISKCLIVK